MSYRITSLRHSPNSHLAAEPAVSGASTFPTDAVAVIYRPARSAMTSGTANSRQWKLRFERRSPPFIEPLMGWTGGDDPLAQVEMTFPSAEAAIAYARRQGLEFVLRRSKEVDITRCHRVSTLKPDDRVCRPATFPARALVKDPSTATVENRPARDDPAQLGPAPDYASPNEVLRDPKRSIEQKREILRRWALAACRLDGTNMHRAAHEESSQLDKIIDARLDLDETAASPFAVKGRSTTRINSRERAA